MAADALSHLNPEAPQFRGDQICRPRCFKPELRVFMEGMAPLNVLRCVSFKFCEKRHDFRLQTKSQRKDMEAEL